MVKHRIEDEVAELEEDKENTRFEEISGQIREYARYARKFAVHQVRDNPIQALAVAAGAGALLAIIAVPNMKKKQLRRLYRTLPKGMRKPWKTIQRLLPNVNLGT
jgi:hypothetical protein